MPQKSILVIDDDDDLGAVLEEVLEGEGFRVRRATSVRDALIAVEEEEPGLALLDWHIPDGDPEDVARLLDERGVPVVLTSGGERTAEHGKRIGAVAVLDKPFDLDELLRVVARYLIADDGAPAYS